MFIIQRNSWSYEETSKNLLEHQIGPFEVEFKFEPNVIASFVNGEKSYDYKYRNFEQNQISSFSFENSSNNCIELDSISIQYNLEDDIKK